MSLRPGVLPFQWLSRATADGWIASPSQAVEERQLQPASLDLRLGVVAYRMRSSFLPGHEPVEHKLAALTMYDIPLAPAAVLERGHVYLIPLLEELALPPYFAWQNQSQEFDGTLRYFYTRHY